jgi:hypothetical protein
MADIQGLRMIGLAYGAVTGLVMLIACVVVSSHALGHLSLDASRPALQQAAAGR